MNSWTWFPAVLIPLALYGFVLWAVYRIASSLGRISQSMEEITYLLQKSLGRQVEPPQ